MENNFYDILGVAQNASEDAIKRAFVKENRAATDENRGEALNTAYETLKNNEKRKQYDAELKYGQKTEILKQKLENTNDDNAKYNIRLELQKLYLDILNDNPNDINALSNIIQIQYYLEDYDSAIRYLHKYIDLTSGEDKKSAIRKLVELYIKNEQYRNASEALTQFYKDGNANVSDIIMLARLSYIYENRINSAVYLLLTETSKTPITNNKIIFLYEIIRALRYTDKNREISQQKPYMKE